MKTEQDQQLIDKARTAAEALRIALSEASKAGLVLQCTAQHSYSEFDCEGLTKQGGWVVRVTGKRSVSY